MKLVELQGESQENFLLRLKALCADGMRLDLAVLALWNAAVGVYRAERKSIDDQRKAEAALRAATPLADILLPNAGLEHDMSENESSLQPDADDIIRSFAAQQIRPGRWWLEIDAYSLTASPLPQAKIPAKLDEEGREFFLAERENLLRDAVLPLVTAIGSGAIQLRAVSPEQQRTDGGFEPIPFENLKQQKWKIGNEGDVQFEFVGNRITYANAVIDFSTFEFVEPGKHSVEDHASRSIPLQSGAPGRPTSVQLVRAELRRMLDTGEIRSSQAAWARDLSDWLARSWPEAPQLSVKSLGNSLRSELREAVLKLKNEG